MKGCMLTPSYRRTAASYKSLLLMASVSLVVMALPRASSAQEGGQTSPAAITAPATQQSAVRLRVPTLEELYGMFFRYAAHVEARSIKDERAGKDRSFYRQHLQQASGLTAQEYADMLDAAQNYVAADADIESQITNWNTTILGNGAPFTIGPVFALIQIRAQTSIRIAADNFGFRNREFERTNRRGSNRSIGNVSERNLLKS